MQPFLLGLADHPEWYALALLLCLAGITVLVHSSAVAIYDPWAIQQVQTVFASAAVIFMWYAGIITGSLATYHVLATSAFFVCAGWIFKAMKRVSLADRRIRLRPLITLRNVLLVILVGAQLGAWAIAGVPLLLESRLNAFAGGGGIGILSRIISFTSFATVFLSVLRIGISAKRKLQRTEVFLLIFTIVASVANASKSNIVLTMALILTSNWLFTRLINGYVPPQVSRKKLAILAATLVLLVLIPAAVDLSRDSGANVGGPLEAIVLRLVFSGDGYMWMYGDDYLSAVTVSSPTALLFSDLLGATRLVPWEQLPVHPGLQIFQMLFPGSDEIRGPNLRVDAFGLLYGDMVGGVFFAAAIGCAFGMARGWLFKARGAMSFLPAAYLFFQAPTFLVDPLLGVTALVNTGFAMAVVVIALAICGRDPFGRGIRIRFSKRKIARTLSTPSTSP